jgi:hypothetical protein
MDVRNRNYTKLKTGITNFGNPKITYVHSKLKMEAKLTMPKFPMVPPSKT